MGILSDNLGTAVRGVVALGFRGINLTIPHKQAIIDYLDELSPEAEIIGAVNTIDVRKGQLKGYNTDGKGFARSIREESGVELSGKSMFLMGAGGAGRAVAVQAGLDQAQEVFVCDCDENRSQRLVSCIQSGIRPGLGTFVPFSPPRIRDALQKSEIFVDATPLGMKADDPLSIDVDWLCPGTFVYDLVYTPPETPLLRAARQRGCKTQGGLGMLLYQGCIAFEIWTGVDAPVEEMSAALRRAVLGKT